MTHLVFNSIPRSGQVFLSNVAQKAYSMPISTAHLPEIFGIKELFHVSNFRNPADCVASLINKIRENGPLPEKNGAIDLDILALKAVETYDRYLEAVKNNLDNVLVVRFEELAKDYRPIIESISKRFSLSANKNYEAYVNLDKSSPIWADKFDGHVPREKDDIRLIIEDRVSSMPIIDDLTARYYDFLTKV